jgi:hypothetical protein
MAFSLFIIIIIIKEIRIKLNGFVVVVVVVEKRCCEFQ